MADKHYGTVPNSEQRKMSGLAFVQGLVDGSQPLNTMAKILDYDVVEAEVGQVVITAAPTREHLNPQGTVHGGYSATLLDACMGLAVATTLEQGLSSTTLEFRSHSCDRFYPIAVRSLRSAQSCAAVVVPVTRKAKSQIPPANFSPMQRRVV